MHCWNLFSDGIDFVLSLPCWYILGFVCLELYELFNGDLPGFDRFNRMYVMPRWF